MSKIFQQLFSKSKTLFFIFSFLGVQVWGRIKQINYSINSSNFNIFSISRRFTIAISILMLLVFGSVEKSIGQVASISMSTISPGASTVAGFENYYTYCYSPGVDIPNQLGFSFTSNSTGTNASTIHTVNWGDGTSSDVWTGTNKTFVHNYSFNSTSNGSIHTVTYSVGSTSTTFQVYIGVSPGIAINPQATALCAPLNQTFTIVQNQPNLTNQVNSPLTTYSLTVLDGPNAYISAQYSWNQSNVPGSFNYNFTTSSCNDNYVYNGTTINNANAISGLVANPCGTVNLTQGPYRLSQQAIANYNVGHNGTTYPMTQVLPEVCTGDQIQLTDISNYGEYVTATSCTNSAGNILRVWNISPNSGHTIITGDLDLFSNGSVSNANSVAPIIQFNVPGTYTIKLKIDNAIGAGCPTNEITRNIIVHEIPTVSVPDIIICNGQQGTLVATPSIPGGLYSWSTNSTTSSIQASPQVNTNYTVSYSLAGCVSPTISATITVNPVPQITLAGQTICAGNSVVLTASPSIFGGTYLWTNPNSTAQSVTVSPSVSTAYQVQYTLSGCSNVANATVTVNPSPGITGSAVNHFVCEGSQVQLQAQGNPLNGTFSWTGPNNFTSTLQNPSVSPIVSSVYTVQYTYNGCIGSDTVNITILPKPQVSVSNPIICLGSPANITSSVNPSGGTYSWSPGGSTTSGLSVTPNTTGVLSYVLTYIGPNGCENKDTSVVTTSITASISVNNPTICSGQSIILNATITNGAATNGIYAWSPGGATTSSITVTPGSTTNYSVTYTLGSCPSITTNATVTVNPTPNVTATGTAICPGATATVTSAVVPTGGSYLWSNNLNTSSITVSPIASTTYSLTYTTLNGCTGTDTANVIIKPIAIVVVNSDTICNGQSALLTATPSITGGTYLWSPGGATTQSITVSPSSTTTYSVQYILNGCSSAIASGVVTVNPLPTLTISSNGGTTICAGQVLTLTGNPNLPNGSFTWSPGGQTTNSITVNPQTTTNYSLIYTLNSCSVTAQLPITVNPRPSVNTTNTTICAGQATSLSSTVSPPGGAYSWTSGATTPNITVNVSSTSTFILSYTVNNCTYSDTSLVTVVPTPVVTINPLTSTICSGASQLLNAVVVGSPTTGSYQWNTGATTSSITVTPSSTQNYSVIYTLNGCPSNSASATVTVNPSPTVTAIGATICPGAVANLTSTVFPSGGSYLWIPGNQTTSSINITPSSATVYTLTYTLNNCYATDTANVIIKPIAIVVVNSDTICNGQSALLTAMPTITGGTYLWSPGGATTQSITVSPTSTTTYSVQYILNGCSSPLANGTVIVKPVPVASIVPNIANPVCAGQIITLTGGANLPNGTYTWTAGGQTTQAINVNPQTTNAYSMVYNLNGCVDTVQYTVNVNPRPLITVNDASICAGSSTTLTATGTPSGGTYSWTGGATTNSITVSPSATTTYIVTYTKNGCSASDTALVQVTNTPTISLTPVNPIICSGSSVLLTATPINSPLTGSYQWNTGATTQSITVSPVIQTTYSVTYVLNGCASLTQSTTVNVNPSPSVNINGISVCPGTSVTIASNVFPNGGTYSWSNNQTPATSSGSSLTVTPGVTTVYTLSYSLNNCTATDTAIVTVKPIPTLTVNNMTICQGQNALLTATPNLSGGSFVWTNGASTPSITVSPSSTTNYSVIYTLAGCSSLNTSATVTVNPFPIATITTNAIPPICSGQSVNLTANINGQYAWSPGSQTSQSITVNPLATTTYTLINTLNGCSDTASYTVIVTPNPTISIVSDTICVGQTASLLAIGLPSGGTYLWTPVNLTTAGITVTPVSTSNYTVNYSLNGCSSSTTSSVLVHPLPNVNAGPDITLCTGTSITLSGTGAQSYSWNNNVINNQGFVPLTNGNYIVTGTDVFGCENTDQVNVTINAYPSVSVNNTTICSGLAASLVASASPSGGTYLWSPNSATTFSISVTPIVNSSYIVSYTLNNCTSTDTSLVSVITSPTLSVNSDTICNGESSNLNAIPSIPGGVYTWSTNETTNAIAVAPTATSNYSVTYNVNGCQSPLQTSIVTVNPVPVITSITAPIICSGQNATLTAIVNITGGTYVWSNGQTGQTISVAPNVTTSYSLIYTLNGCSSAPFSTNVTVNQSPTINAGSDQLLCAGQSTTLNPTVSGLGGAFLWSPSTGLNNNQVQNPTVTLSSTQNYTVVYTLNGCSSLPDTVIINVIQNPVASVNNATVCNGTAFTLTASPANASYIWSTGETTSSISPSSPIGTTNYTVTVVIPGCPTSTATSVVIVNPIPTITVGVDRTVCNGLTAVLTSAPSPAGGTYLWSPSGQTTQSLSLAPSLTSPLLAQDFTQTLVYTLNNCSSVADTGIIHVNPIPTASVPNQTICNQGTAILTPVVAPLGGTYAWSPSGQTTTQNTVNPTATTTYSLIYTLNGCNSLAAAATVTVNPNPTITVNSQTICNEQSTTLTATPNQTGGSYYWLPGGQVSQSITVSPSVTSSYSCVYTLNGCPSASVSGAVTVNPVPTLSLSDTTICGGFSVNLLALTNIPNGTFTWSPGGQNTQGISVAPTTTTVYTVNYTAPNGCAAIPDQGTVTVIQNPTASVLNDTICLGQSTTLVANPNGASYTWSGSNITTSTTLQQITVNPTSTTTYTVVTQIGSCPTSTATATVVVNPIPTVTAAPAQTICNGQTVTIGTNTSTNNGTYAWTPSGTNASLTVTPILTNPTQQQTFTYSVIYTLNGCPSLPSSTTVIVNPIPTVSLPNSIAICNGSSGNIASTVNLSGGTYVWNPAGPTTDNITVNPTSSTNYSVTYSLNGCSATSNTANLVVNPIPTVSVNNSTICDGTQATLTAVGSPPNIGTYLWSTSATSAAINVNPNTSTNYTVTYTVNGCPSQSATAAVTVNPIPSLNVPDATICGGGSVQLTGNGTPASGTYLWTGSGLVAPNNQQSQITVNPAATTNYTVSYTANGCTANDNFTVTVIQNPTASVLNDTICLGQSTTLVANPNGASYTWSGSNITTPTTLQQITVNPTSTTTYTVVTQIGSCPTSTATATVVVNPIPTVQAAPPQTICNGQAVTIGTNTSGPNGTYAWNPSGTNASLTVTPILANPIQQQTFTYSVIYTLDGCPSLPSTSTVTVNPKPTISVNSLNICSGASDTIEAHTNLSGGTYYWSTGITGLLDSSIIVSHITNPPNQITTFNYSAWYVLNGCSSDTIPSVVTVSPIPVLTTANPLPICSGTALNILLTSNTAGSTFSWSASANPNFTGESTTAQATNTINDLLIITPTPGIETVDYNVINSFNGCSNTFQLSVVVNPAPFINTINDIICSGGSFDTIPNPIASGNFIPSGTTYSWSVAANNSVLNETGSVNQNPNIFNSGPLTSSSITNTTLAYSVIPTSGNCIGSTFNLNITVTPTPSISNQLGSICSGNFPTITALPGDVIPSSAMYTWTIVSENENINGQINQGVGVSDLSNQVLVNQTNIPQSLTYSITPSSGPCPGSPFTLTVTVNPGPSIDTALYTICSGNSLTVTLGQGNDIITVGTTFIWNVMPNTNITGQTSNNIPSPNFFTGTLQNFQSVNDTLEYWLTPTGPANQNPQCNGSPFPVFVIVKPTPNLSNTLLNDICSGTSFTYDPNQNLTPSSIYNANTVLTWTVTPNLNVSGWTNSVGTNNPTITQILTNLTNTVQTVVYNATANDTLSLCSSTVFSVTVNVQPTPLIQSQTASVCSGNPFVITPSITNNQPTQIVPNGILYSWATPTSNPPNLIIGGSAQTNQASISQVLNIQPPNPPQFGSLTYIVVPSYPVSASLTCQGLPFNVTVNVNPIPIIETAFAQPETICFGSISTLQAVALPNLIPPGGTYNWTPIAQLSNPLATTAIITTLPLNNTTTFIVTYTLPANLGSCQSQAYPVTVTVQAPPNILTITAVENEFCVGGCTNITANFVGAVAVDSVQWSTGQVTYFFPHSIQVCPNDTTTYTATAFLGGCNGNIANININVNPDPIISLQPYTDTAICVGGTLPLTIQVLNGAGNPTYQWYQNQINSNIGGTLLPSPPPFGPSYQPQPFNTAGSFYYYCVISYAPSGCGFLTTLPSEINVIADPIVQIIGQDETLCIGGTPQCLNAVISGGIGNVVQYEWNQGGSDSTFCPPNIPIGIEDYTVSVLQTGVGCSSNSIDTITVSILPDPIITIIGITAACEGAIVPLSTSVTGGIGNVVQYQWQEANPIGYPYLPIDSSNSDNYTTDTLLNDVGYSVSIIQSGNGCAAADIHTIMIYDDPELNLIGSPYSCLGEETSITANIVGGTPSSTNSLTWYAYPAGVINPLIIQGPNNDLTYDFLLTGDTTIYVESVNSGFGCDLVTESITIQGLTPAVASFEVSNTIQSLIDPTFSFTNTSENATDYFWNLGECDPQAPASELFTTPTPFYNPTNQDQMEYTYGCAPGLYQIMLIAYNQGICPDTAYQVIQIQDGVSVYIPNTFTPDGDMTNQYFFPVIASIISPNTFLFSIYNRWGEEVFISKDPNEKWDGNNYVTNNKCQDGVYIWKLRFIMKESGEVINKVGHVNLLR